VRSKAPKVLRYIVGFDTHYPKVDWPTFNAMLRFMEKNQIDGFIWGGDQLDNQECSPYTKGKAKLRVEAGTLKTNDKEFDKKCLKQVESLLPAGAEKIWIDGNHDDWRQQLIDEHPELDGLQTYQNLDLKDRGWKQIERGKHYKNGNLTVIHGDSLAGIGNQIPGGHAKKAVEAYCTNVLYGHFHSPQSFTKILPFDVTERWMSWCSPILGDTNPIYLQNKPTAWLTGFTIVEYRPDGRFNVYPVVVIDGEFAFAGELYNG
jgi:predicted phosphodiesterase